MRPLATFLLAALLGGCATTNVALLSGEPGVPVGAVAVLDPKTEADRAVLDQANTQATVGSGAVRARPVDPARYAALTGSLPAPPMQMTLYFLEGTTQLAPGQEDVLQQLFIEVGNRPGAEVQITGHTDTVGSDADNDRLSRQRAAEIRAALVQGGQLDGAITRATGRGEREPLVATPDNVGEPRNRRVEITVR